MKKCMFVCAAIAWALAMAPGTAAQDLKEKLAAAKESAGRNAKAVLRKF